MSTESRFHRPTVLKWAGLATVATLFGVGAPVLLDQFYLSRLTQIVILGIFGIVFNWAFGFTDLPAFGHAAFFGLGAYVMALLLQSSDSLLFPLAAGLLATLLFSAVVGIISVRGHGIYFALITFAFAQFLYEVVFRWTDVTGGSQGMFLTVPAVLGVQPTKTDTLFYLSYGFLLATLVFGYRLINSPFGKVMQAIHYNEERARTIGYPVTSVKITIFTLTGLLSGVAGILSAFRNTFVAPQMLFWETSIEVIIISIIGGSTTLVGPAVGAVFIILLDEVLTDFANFGTVMTGIVFITVIVFMPNGIVGTLKNRFR